MFTRIDKPTNIDSRALFASILTREALIDKPKCIAINESGFNIHLRRSRARYHRGSQASLTIPNVLGWSVSLIVATNQDAILFKRVISESTVNAQTFEEFISDLVDAIAKDSSLIDSWILMDNARIHRRATLLPVVESRGFRLQFHPPYSYMLNAVEFVFKG